MICIYFCDYEVIFPLYATQQLQFASANGDIRNGNVAARDASRPQILNPHPEHKLHCITCIMKYSFFPADIK